MKTITEIEKMLELDQNRGLRIFANSSLDRTTLISMLTAAYLSGYSDATKEATCQIRASR